MQLDLHRFRGRAETLDRLYEPERFGPADADFQILIPVRLTGEIRKDGRKYEFTGRVATMLECACSRCLEPFPVPVDAAFDLLFLPFGESLAQGAEDDEGQEIAEDDLGVTFYKDDTIDLGEVMREQFYLALPMKPLCREECRGLCPVCGINRNRETCQCDTTWHDPRMEGLRRLRGGHE